MQALPADLDMHDEDQRALGALLNLASCRHLEPLGGHLVFLLSLPLLPPLTNSKPCGLYGALRHSYEQPHHYRGLCSTILYVRNVLVPLV